MDFNTANRVAKLRAAYRRITDMVDFLERDIYTFMDGTDMPLMDLIDGIDGMKGALQSLKVEADVLSGETE